MLYWIIAISCIAAGLAIWAIWLLNQRGTLLAAAATERVQRERAESDLTAARAERDAERVKGEARAAALQSTLDATESRAAAEQSELKSQLAHTQTLLQSERDEHSALIEQLEIRQRDALLAAKSAHEQEIASLRRETEQLVTSAREALSNEKTLLQESNRKLEERIAALNQQTREAFDAAAKQAISAASTDFLRLAETKMLEQQQSAAGKFAEQHRAIGDLVKPIGDTLRKTEEKLGEIERARTESFGQISEQLRAVAQHSDLLRKETGTLVGALKRPEVRGSYGEIQLRRVVELAGMREYCDFDVQHSTTNEAGKQLRPDMIVRLPNDRQIVVDAKCNILGYLDALEASDEIQRDIKLNKFADDVIAQVSALAKKQYASNYSRSADFVVMFIPGDQFVDAAARRRPELLEDALAQGIIIATPATLIGLLKAVHMGWNEKRIGDQAEELRRLGKELHERAATAWEKLSAVGTRLNQAVEAYNGAVGSIESRLTPTLRKFEDAGAASGKDLETPQVVTLRARQSQLMLPEAE
ncbi:MAG: DNA recombination protein RmuC [Planctomycetes bacterium]|nr:DNA recombination protein RmuC [Planctomycetota bacterium]